MNISLYEIWMVHYYSFRMNILNVYFVEISFSFTLILTFFFQILPPKPPQKIQDKYFCYLQQMSNESWGIFQKLPVFLPIVLGFFLSAGNLVFVPCIAKSQCLRFLYLYPLRHLLHHCFQALMDHGVKVASILANSFSRRCSYIAESDAHVKEKAIQFGFVLGQQLCCWFVLFIYYCWLLSESGSKVCVFLSGGFLSDAGWYGDAEKVFLSCLQLCMLHDEILHWYRALECCVRWGLSILSAVWSRHWWGKY